IKDLVFPTMSEIHFKNLIEISEWKDFNKNEQLVEEGIRINELILINEGQVSIKAKNNIIGHVSDGGFVGEMSFLTRSKPTASVTTVTPTTVISWNKLKLEKLMEKDPMFKNELFNVFSSDLIKKLIEKNEHN
ncbi:cyclic nucleotide-binding domain-containing protein, partial [Candidatus Kapabacteria bacterium]|nr:cyclic nucleotide-binding domain-containing protein [Candidatus Kapabacteria bacterium]